MALDPNTIIDLQHNLDKIKKEHALLEEQIQSLLTGVDRDDLKVYRLKKEKLVLKDRIAKIDGLLTPNIIA